MQVSGLFSLAFNSFGIRDGKSRKRYRVLVYDSTMANIQMFCGNRDEFYTILICLISIHLGAFFLSICPCLHIKSDWSKYLVKMRKHIKLWILKAEQYHKQYKIKTHKTCINYFAQLCNSCLHLTECSLVLYKKIILNIFLWWVF